MVVDTSGSERNAVLGDLVANKARHRGIAGFIVDGQVRDLAGLREAGLPVHARGVTTGITTRAGLRAAALRAARSVPKAGEVIAVKRAINENCAEGFRIAKGGPQAAIRST